MKTPASKLNGSGKRAVAVDIVLFTIQDGKLNALLVKRENAPYRGAWALPGGLVDQDESVDAAALRELQEETNIDNIYLEQLYTFGDANRDPRGHIITVAYYALVNGQRFELKSRFRVTDANWFPLRRLPDLAFDHRKIIDYALERLRSKINYTTVGFQLMSKQFTLTELQRSYEVIVAKRLDKRNFRRKMLQLGIMKETKQFKSNGRQRPARLYTFTEPKVIKLQEKGIIVPF